MEQNSQQGPKSERMWSGDKWEYLYLQGYDDSITAEVTDIGEEMIGKVTFLGTRGPAVTEVLNDLGRQGWEMVSAYSVGDSSKGFRMIFKRLIQE